MKKLNADILFEWVRQQADDKPIVMNQSRKNEVYTVGCVLMQFANTQNIEYTHAGWAKIYDSTGDCVLCFDTLLAGGQNVVENFTLACNRKKCLTFEDAKRILDEGEIMYHLA